MSFAEEKITLSSSYSMSTLYYKDDYATIELDEIIPCVKLKLDGLPRYSEHYQFVQKKRLELIYREIKNYPKLHMLTDSRNAGPVLDEDVAYFKTQVLPAMEEVGIRYLAIVMPSNKFTQLTIRDMTHEPSIMKIQLFESIQEARKWLMSI
jgi:hypothetical protein